MATLELYDPAGRRVRTLYGRAGESLVWDGRDEGGRVQAPGVYLCVVDVGGRRQRGHVVVLR